MFGPAGCPQRRRTRGKRTAKVPGECRMGTLKLLRGQVAACSRSYDFGDAGPQENRVKSTSDATAISRPTISAMLRVSRKRNTPIAVSKSTIEME